MQRRAFEVTAGWDDVEEQELDPPALDRLDEIGVPALVLAGGLDLDAILDTVGRVTAGIAGARRVDWPDAGHLPSLEYPAAFTALLLDWVKTSPNAAT
jgi:pimeloyl-ACP methyl ester carboxylesterase